MRIENIDTAQRLVLINPYRGALLRRIDSEDRSWKPMCITKQCTGLRLFEEIIVTEQFPIGTVGNMQPYCSAVLVTSDPERLHDYEILLTHMDSIYWMDYEKFQKTSRLQRLAWKVLAKLPEWYRL